MLSLATCPSPSTRCLPSPACTQLSDELSSEHYAVGVKKGNTELAQKITDTLKAMNEDGTVKQLCEKYADYGLSYENWILK